MTLLGVDTWDVRATAGPKYTVKSVCANPGCKKLAEHAHHIVRRSHLGGREERNWVEVKGETIANLCGLCPGCHDNVTGRVGGHQAAIYLVETTWWWCLVDHVDGQAIPNPVAPLDPHPPTLEGAEHASKHEAGSETCPTCGQKRRRGGARPDAGPGPARRRKSWVVKVPDDEQENGAQILDTLVDDLALVLGYDPGPSARYYVLVPALWSAQTNRKRFANEIKGVGE